MTFSTCCTTNRLISQSFIIFSQPASCRELAHALHPVEKKRQSFGPACPCKDMRCSRLFCSGQPNTRQSPTAAEVQGEHGRLTCRIQEEVRAVGSEFARELCDIMKGGIIQTETQAQGSELWTRPSLLVHRCKALLERDCFDWRGHHVRFSSSHGHVQQGLRLTAEWVRAI